MRILQVHNRHRDPGGEDMVVAQERDLLLAGGHEVESLEVMNPAGAPGAAAAMVLAPSNPIARRRTVAAARRFRPDVVHVHNTWFALSPAVIAGLAAAGWPVVVTLHNFRTVCANGLLQRQGRLCLDCVGRSPLPAVRHRCYRGSVPLSALAALTISLPRWQQVWIRSVERFVVLDDAAVDPLVAGGIPAHRITVRPNFVPDPGRRPGPPSAGHELLFVGRLSPEKGAERLLHAWSACAPPGLQLTLYGEGPLRTTLEAITAGSVSFAGRVPREQITRAMLGARGLIFPSTVPEAGPLAPLEAAGAGLPVLMSSTVAMSREIAENGAGWVVPDGDAAAMGAALQRFGDPTTVDQAGSRARHMYDTRHSPAVALDALEGLYRSAISQRGGARVPGQSPV